MPQAGPHRRGPHFILRSGEPTAALPDLEPWFVTALSYEPAISTGGAHLGDGSWEREVTRSVMQFRGMHTVEEYIDKTGEIVASNAAQFRTDGRRGGGAGGGRARAVAVRRPRPPGRPGDGGRGHEVEVHKLVTRSRRSGPVAVRSDGRSERRVPHRECDLHHATH